MADAAVQAAHIDLARARRLEAREPGPLFSAQFLDRCTGWVSAHQAAKLRVGATACGGSDDGFRRARRACPVYPAASVLQVFVDGDQVHGDDDRHERSEEN